MPVIKNIGPELLQTYDAYDSTRVGAGLINPDIYRTPGYSKKKIQTLILGGLSRIVYSAYEVSPMPLILSMGVEPQYNTVLGINLLYVPIRYRQAILKFVLDSNAARIRGNLPILVDYPSLKRAIPEVRYIVRRYKQVLIRVDETYPLVEWPNVIKKAENTYQNTYRLIKEGRVR